MLNESPRSRGDRTYCIGGARCVFYGSSIIVSLVVYGLYQERIMSQAYGHDYFTLSVFLVLFNRVFGIVFAIVMALIMNETLLPHAAVRKYILISVTTVVASICQFEALKYTTFTVAILGKSVKMMPVMLWGRAILGRKHKIKDWVAATGVTTGVIWFMLSGPVWPEHHNGNTWYGILLLLAFTILDGFTAAFQERLFVETRTTKYNQMLYINFASSVLSILILAISGNTRDAFNFCYNHPVVYGDIAILSGSSVVAQWFIYSQVQEFGALVFAFTMNVRQIVSVLASYIVWHHSVTEMQIVGLGLVAFFLLFQVSVAWLAERQDEKTALLGEGQDRTSPRKPTGGLKMFRGWAAALPCLNRQF
jgi:adenosine 3'-phospho 5'-phosphosulfate transporter B2